MFFAWWNSLSGRRNEPRSLDDNSLRELRKLHPIADACRIERRVIQCLPPDDFVHFRRHAQRLIGQFSEATAHDFLYDGIRWVRWPPLR